MAKDWRASLTLLDPRAGEKSFLAGVLNDLRSRLGADVAVSSGKMCIFLYAETAGVAGWAAQKAQEVLGQYAVAAEFQLERWDTSGQAWQDAEGGRPDQVTTGRSAAEGKAGRRFWKVADAVWSAVEGFLPPQ